MELSSGLVLKAVGGLAAASTVTTVGILKGEDIAVALGLKSEKLNKSILKSLFPDCKDFSNSTCKLTGEQLKKVKIISKDDETWDPETIEGDNPTSEIVTVSWEKSKEENADFPLGWVFTIKPVDSTKTITVKKDDTKKISITKSGVKLWLKEKEESGQKKYYLAEELTYTKANNKLIEYINKNGHDIVFKVLKDETGTTDLKNADLALETTNTPKTITIRVEVKTSSADQFKGTDSSKTITELKGLNTGNADWNWECKIKLTTEDTISSKVELSDKDKLFKDGENENGFFNVLKKDSSTATSLDSTKKTKIKFIENCASEARNLTTPRKLTSSKLAAEKTFQLKLGATGEAWGVDSSKLFFQIPTEFKEWFSIVS